MHFPSQLKRIGILAALFCCGCNLVEHPKSATRRLGRMFTPRPWDSKNEPGTDDGDWDFVGEEGRSEFEREKDPDGWYKKYLMSEKANAIERNLGID
jgi:hypothetical protein